MLTLWLCVSKHSLLWTSQQVSLLQVLLCTPFHPCQYVSHLKNNSEGSVKIALELYLSTAAAYRYILIEQICNSASKGLSAFLLCNDMKKEMETC